jgi:hypothetical protein
LNEPRHKAYPSFDEAYRAAKDGDHIHFVCGRQSREPTKCMCGKYPVANTQTAWSTCEYCGCL